MIKLSKHLAGDLDRRRIRMEYIEAAIENPDRITGNPNDLALRRSFKAIQAFGNRVLRVVHRPDNGDIFVVTAHWDRGANRR